ncbi:hypothetical protein [Streptomyces sp. NPDC001948]
MTSMGVVVGCMAERYGKDLAEALPEADGHASRVSGRVACASGISR